MTQKHIDALRELSYQRGQLCPDCRRAWPVCDDDDAYRRPDERRCSGKVAREVLAALTEDVKVDALTSLPPYGGPLRSEVWDELRADLLGKDRPSLAPGTGLGSGHLVTSEQVTRTCTDWCKAREQTLGIAWDKLVIAKKALEEILLECDLNRGRALIVDSVRQCAIAALQNIAADQGGKP